MVSWLPRRPRAQDASREPDGVGGFSSRNDVPAKPTAPVAPNATPTRRAAKQPKSYGVRFPGREADLEALLEATEEKLVNVSMRLLLAGAVRGLLLTADASLADAEALVRKEMARRKRRRRDPNLVIPDSESHLYSVRLGPIETEFESLKGKLTEFAPDLDDVNQTLIAAAIDAYLPASPATTDTLCEHMREVARLDRAHRSHGRGHIVRGG